MFRAEVVVLEGDIRRKDKSGEIIIQDARWKIIIKMCIEKVIEERASYILLKLDSYGWETIKGHKIVI